MEERKLLGYGTRLHRFSTPSPAAEKGDQPATIDVRLAMGLVREILELLAIKNDDAPVLGASRAYAYRIVNGIVASLRFDIIIMIWTRA